MHMLIDTSLHLSDARTNTTQFHTLYRPVIGVVGLFVWKRKTSRLLGSNMGYAGNVSRLLRKLQTWPRPNLLEEARQEFWKFVVVNVKLRMYNLPSTCYITSNVYHHYLVVETSDDIDPIWLDRKHPIRRVRRHQHLPASVNQILPMHWTMANL